jgi:hypothetical protein
MDYPVAIEWLANYTSIGAFIWLSGSNGSWMGHFESWIKLLHDFDSTWLNPKLNLKYYNLTQIMSFDNEAACLH